MREFSTPADDRDPDHRQPHRRRRPNARERRRRRRVQPPDRRRLGGRHRRRASCAEVGGRRQGPDRRRRRGRRPGRPDVARPATSGRCSTTPIWFAGAVTVPIYETSSAEQIGWILADSGARAGRRRDRRPPAPGSTSVRAELARAARRLVASTTTRVDVLARGSAPTSSRRRAREAPYGGDPARPRDADLHLRHDRPAQGLHAHPRQLHVRARRRRRRAATSCSSTDDALDAAVPAAGARLRPDHPGRLRQEPGPARATPPTSRTWSPTSAPSSRPSSSPCRGCSRRSSTPPRQRATADGKGKIFDAAADDRRSPTASAEDRAGPARCGPRQARGCSTGSSTASCAPRSAAAAQYAVSGGAPLGERLGHFFRGIGLTVLEGYGLTETTAALTVNLPDAHKIGTVGRPLPGTRVRIADDGEVLFRGGQVFAGYWNNDDGDRRGARRRRLVPHRRRRRARRRRLRPDHRPQEGDPGHRRRQERRAGRARGPAPRAPAGQPVHGRRRRPAVHRRAGHHRPRGVPGAGPRRTASRQTSPTCVDDPDLRAEIAGRGRRRQQGGLARPRRSGSSRSSPVDWTEEGGQLTPTLKLKRNVVMREFRDDVAALYDR